MKSRRAWRAELMIWIRDREPAERRTEPKPMPPEVRRTWEWLYPAPGCDLGRRTTNVIATDDGSGGAGGPTDPGAGDDMAGEIAALRETEIEPRDRR